MSFNGNQLESGSSGFLKYLILVLILHLGFISLGFFGINKSSSAREFIQSSMDVSIIEEKVKPEIKAAEKINTESVKKTPARKAPVVKSKKPSFSKKKKKIVKKRTNKPKKIVKKNILSTREVEKTISKYKEEVSTELAMGEVANDIKKFKQNLSVKGKSSKNGVFSGMDLRAAEAEKIDKYRYKVAHIVERKWALPSELINAEEHLETFIVFNVLPDGTIENIWFDKKSGNNYFDDSVFRAVQKADPVLPHPDDIMEKLVVVGLRFTPKGLR